jgi:hypothetical protein
VWSSFTLTPEPSRTIFDLPIAAWAMRGDEADHEAAQ